MGLEASDTLTSIYIDDLNPAYPVGSDQKAQGDDHLRLIKRILKNTFPNIGGPVTLTETDINTPDVLSVTDAIAEPTTVSGRAQIYVDEDDDHLKVKFSDGTINTISGSIINVADFGAVGDGVTDDTAAIQAAINAAKAAIQAEVWRDGDLADFGPKVAVVGSVGSVYGISSELLLDDCPNIILKQLAFKAIGSSWATSDFMLRAASDTTYITIEDCLFDGDRKCSLVKLYGRTKLTRCWLTRFADKGVLTNGGVWIDHCFIDEWLRDVDSEWNTGTNFTGIAVDVNSTDAKITHNIIRWAGEIIRIRSTSGAVLIADNHFYNGHEDLADRPTYHMLVVEDGAAAVALNDNYFDCGTFELYNDRVAINNCAWIYNSAYMDSGYIIKVFANSEQDGDYPRLRVSGTQIFGASGSVPFIQYLDYGAYTWAEDYSAFNASTYSDFSASNSMEGAEVIGRHRIFFNGSDNGIYQNIRTPSNNGIFIKFSDAGTTTDVLVGGNSDNLRLEGGEVRLVGSAVRATNVAGDMLVDIRADLGSDPEIRFREATVAGSDATYTDRGALWYDNSVNDMVLESGTDLRIKADTELDFYTDGTLRWHIGAAGNLVPDGVYDVGSSTDPCDQVYADGFQLTDGVTAPSATSGQAKIYVDTADGDLKVTFGDGTTKVIAQDTSGDTNALSVYIGATSQSITSQVTRFEKIGSTMFFEAEIVVGAVSGTGTLTITGFPTAAANCKAVITVGFAGSATALADPVGLFTASSGTLNIYADKSTTAAWAVATNTALNSTATTIRLSGHYPV